ncbi:MAG: ABC transporter ATP-binding protein [Hyphomonadaceae bacterium]
MKTWPLIARLWREHVARYKLDLIALTPVLIAVAATATAYGLVLKTAIDWISRGDYAAAMWAPLLVVGVTTARAIAMWAQSIIAQGLSLKVLRDLQGALFESLVRADFARLTREDTGRHVSRFTNDINIISDGIVRAMQAVLRDALTLLGAIASMFYFDWILGFMVIAIFALAGRPLARIAARARAQTEKAQDQAGLMTALLAESLGAPRFIKTYGLEEREIGRAKAAFETRRKLTMKLTYNRARTEPMLEVLGGIALAAVLGVAAWRISHGAMTIGDLLGIVAAVGVAAPAARSLSSFNTVLNEALAALQRLMNAMDEAPRVRDAPGAKPLSVREGRLAFEHVRFAYGDAPALRDVSFIADKGERIALVGPSGAGKSTIFNLAVRLFDPSAGRITIDGQDIRSVTLASARAASALVAQDATLFNDTVRANIAFGRPGAAERDIIAAAKAAAAHDFIQALPGGYNALVGERGGALSGGERQRIALARAFLRDAPILLLDEATSALDAASEAQVQEALARLSAGRTTLIIAHRLATVRDADRILVLKDGAICEQGGHDALLARDGLYASLYKLQFQE